MQSVLRNYLNKNSKELINQYRKSILVRCNITNKSYSIPVVITASHVRTCHLEDHFIGKITFPRDHLLVIKCIGVDIIMSVVAIYLRLWFLVPFLMCFVVQISVTVVVPEVAVNRYQNGACCFW